MTRITRDQMFMQMTRAASLRSTCFRLNVGAIIVDPSTGKPLSIGYNGSPPGAPHCAGNDCPGKHACHETIHAEDNAIRGLPAGLKSGLTGLDLYVTHSPCSNCSDLIVKSGLIGRVVFEVPYRNSDHLLWLLRHNIDIQQLTPSGYLMDWNTNRVIELP